MAIVFSILGVALFVAIVVGFSIWSRRIESEMDFEQAPGVMSEEQANALRLGIGLSANNPQIGGH